MEAIEQVKKEIEQEIQQAVEAEIKRFTAKFGIPADQVVKSQRRNRPFVALTYVTEVAIGEEAYKLVFRNFTPRDVAELDEEDLHILSDHFSDMTVLLAKKLAQRIGGKIAWDKDENKAYLYVVHESDSIEIVP